MRRLRRLAERRLAAAWAGVLSIPQDQIGRRDHFFDRGGTSLSAVQLAIALDRAVSLKDITEHPVLADLAGVIDGRSGARSSGPACGGPGGAPGCSRRCRTPARRGPVRWCASPTPAATR